MKNSLSYCENIIIFSFLLGVLQFVTAEETIRTALNSQRYLIKEIKIFGNEKTKFFVILREIKTQTGDSVTASELETEQMRVQNLGLFTRVEIELEALEDGYALIIAVTERWYIFPYPIYFRNDKDWKKLSYGFGLAHLNFRGRKEMVDLNFYLGYNKKLNFTYYIPWFIPRWQIYASLNLFAARDKSKNLAIQQYQENRQTYAFALGKRFGLFTYLDFAISHNTFSTSSDEIVRSLSPGGNDAWFNYAVSFKYDHRDLYEFPRNGWYLKSYWLKSGRMGNAVNYSRYGLDFRRYIPLPGNTVIAARGDVDLARGRVPAYDRLYLGYSERIRGYFYEQFEGENRCVGNLAFRFPIRKITYHTIFQDTPFADYYRNLKFGISGGIFVDAGAVWYQTQILTADFFKVGWGLGLFFHLPYVDLARIEYAFNRAGQGEFILFDLGVAF